jgi:hypothetical protein
MEYYYIYDEKKRFTHERSLEKKTKSTEIKPPNIGSDEVAIFDEIKESWSLQKDLQKTKTLKLFSLVKDYNDSKTIILQNGNTLAIKHDTKERKFFTDNLENLKRIEEAENSVLSYWQEVDGALLGFSALSYIWKHLFLGKFTEQRPSLTLESRRSKNKEIYDIKKLKIENANSIQELEGIDWSFEDIAVININVEAQKLLDDPETPEYVIEAINALKGEDGQIHLIKEL